MYDKRRIRKPIDDKYYFGNKVLLVEWRGLTVKIID